nr:PREDICTED: immunoglobulin-like domain-containing receptor 1 [Latimeria chalumnae]|eukprot:XP_014353060.1 PREDICTED: immunoglobulin-like domain-containing receptor 1 [Latimeria chalumnae]
MPTVCLALLVSVQYTHRYTMLFASVILRCDYTTSAQLQDVVVTWRFKSFCKDPILDYYSASYQAGLDIGQDPTNDCHDEKREVRIVLQKRGNNEPVLGWEYRQRKITIENRADLAITEVMWWDHGVYYCTIEAPGDTNGDPDKEVRLVVLSKIAVKQYRMVKDAKKGLIPWWPFYPNADGSSSFPPNSELHREYSLRNNMPMTALPTNYYPPPNQFMPPNHFVPPNQFPPPAHYQPPSNTVLEYLEKEVKGLNPIQPVKNTVHFEGSERGSMVSSLNEMRDVERRVIHLPPIVERVVSSQRSSNTSRARSFDSGHRDNVAEDLDNVPRRQRSGEGSWSNRSRNSSRPASRDRRQRGGSGRSPRRDQSPPRRWHNYSDESDYDDRRGRSNYRRPRNSSSRSPDRRPRYRSADDLSLERNNRRGDRSPTGRRGSWSSDDAFDGWREKPPSYRSVEIKPGSRRNGGVNSERGSSRSGRSIVI